ncbi:MAG: oxidoreductase, partial [Alphaproteobacteria bacterium]|nr:oxidoreductase [Alphaproteobacteria bacterium]
MSVGISKELILPNGVVLSNRLVKSGLSEALADAHNNPTPALTNLFAKWGEGGAAVLITGHTSVDRLHLEHAGNCVFDDESPGEAFAAIAKAGKRHGTKMLMQLAHSGRQTPEAINPHPVSISDLRLDLPGYGVPIQATDAMLHDIIGKFVRSALRAQQAGFDGVEIHAAHGYLFSSSLSPRINTRDDAWGGSPARRARLVLEVVRAVRAAVAPEFIVATKLNSSDFQKGGFDIADSIEVAVMLEAEGIDFIEISGGNFETPVAYAHQSKKQSTRAREG